MRRITKKLWSHDSNTSKIKYFNKDIRKSCPKFISNYKDLVKEIAIIATQNKDYSLFFRGQNKDYTNIANQSSMYPTIFRGRRLLAKVLQKRYEELELKSKFLLEEITKKKSLGHREAAKFPELLWSIIQHYEVAPTPLSDVTQSIRVAASFALPEKKRNNGFVYVLGLPHPTGSMTYSVEEELLLIRLLSICPPDAIRPYFQEGFLVSTFPLIHKKKTAHLDLGKRLIAKFEIHRDTFWDNDFHAIPEDALYPLKDDMETICNAISKRTI